MREAHTKTMGDAQLQCEEHKTQCKTLECKVRNFSRPYESAFVWPDEPVVMLQGEGAGQSRIENDTK